MAHEIDGKVFPPTRISAVVAAGSEHPSERARGLERLVRAYHKPAYKHARMRWRRSREDAEEIVQSFFGRALEQRTFSSYDPAKGHFRTYLKTCLDRFVVDGFRAEGRMKRGGQV